MSSNKRTGENMKNLGTQNIRHALVLLIAGSVLVSCTKSVPYKEVYKEEVQAKSIIDESTEYLYVASTDTSSSDQSGASTARPFWQSDAEVTKFRFTEKALQAVSVVKDSRLKGNSLNEKIILEIPISHLEYRCSEDRYKKCTNQEEVNNELNWKLRTQFKPEFAGLKVISANMIPVEMEKVFGSSCYTETASSLHKYEITKEAINIQIAKTYQANVGCLSERGISIRDLSDLQSQVIQHYSFTKMNTLVSVNYKSVLYPKKDENEFGFFTTDNNKLDVDYNQLESQQSTFLNRWNPDRKEIVYFLSDNFNKPEYASIKKATQTAFDRFNDGLKKANVQTRLVLKEPSNKAPGDARNSMIVMVEDPNAAGPLGYGPSVTNPRTGEIVSARTVMYYGNLLTGLKSTYDEIVQEIHKRQAAESAAAMAKGLSVDKNQSETANQVNKNLNQKIAHNYMTTKHSKTASHNHNHNVVAYEKSLDIRSMSRQAFMKANTASDRQMMDRDALSSMSKHCNYPSEYVDFDNAIRTSLHAKLGQNLKYWKDLSDSERQSIIDIVAPVIWIPTLVHELGHNVGLRHNFGGSEDKANFYSKDELAQMGVKHEVPYSSVMDYGYSELNLLPTLGKYDIAALRFGYSREVELKDGKIAAIKTTLKDLLKDNQELKAYSYCSDEHVEVNPNCKRFDKGTNLVEIAKFLTANHDRLYARRNFRNDRINFSMADDGSAANGRRTNFEYIRAFMERYESIKSRFNLADDAKEWKEVEFLKEIKESALISGRFFMDVLTTPDLTCAIVHESAPTNVMVQRLESISTTTKDCFDLQLNTSFKVVGQTGKAFNHRKDPGSENYYMDQIDVRGFYIDKIAAAEALFKRKIGNTSYDKVEDNYLDIAELSEEVTATLNGLLFGNLQKEALFKDQNGNEIGKFKIQIDLTTAPTERASGKLSHWIPAPLNEKSAKSLGLPDHIVSFQQVLLNIVDSSMKGSQAHWQEDRAFADAYRIVKTSKAYQVDSSTASALTDIGTTRLVALKDNMASAEAVNLYKFTDLLGKLSEEQLKTYLAEQESNRQIRMRNSIEGLKTSFPAEYQQIPLGFAQAYAKGGINSDWYKYLLTILPASNY